LHNPSVAFFANITALELFSPSDFREVLMAQILAPVSFTDTDLPFAGGCVTPLSGGVSQVINP
jgi:hypothetical protein